jgi:hypothetical protein
MSGTQEFILWLVGLSYAFIFLMAYTASSHRLRASDDDDERDWS